jgi:hypothetical protein
LNACLKGELNGSVHASLESTRLFYIRMVGVTPYCGPEFTADNLIELLLLLGILAHLKGKRCREI